ncbi:hypothetical protein Y032_0417g1102 [Ancylostoma ceylanicum]|uniref:Uncharacterized protein n=1 Tax=Ancylostoma ceylanicum TaxID=53326 RepID=A0A016X2J9_9BILA|nr:hypothetical protein Y032_0417g1102 [Ancylostoma ceylanicum]
MFKRHPSIIRHQNHFGGAITNNSIRCEKDLADGGSRPARGVTSISRVRYCQLSRTPRMSATITIRPFGYL